MAIPMLAARLFQSASRSMDSLISRLARNRVKVKPKSIPIPRLVAAPLSLVGQFAKG
jgi:hypothetical protein